MPWPAVFPSRGPAGSGPHAMPDTGIRDPTAPRSSWLPPLPGGGRAGQERELQLCHRLAGRQAGPLGPTEPLPVREMLNRSPQGFYTDNVAPRGHGNVCRHFWLVQLRRAAYGQLVGRGQGCCSTSCNAQDSPTTKDNLGPNINMAKGERF